MKKVVREEQVSLCRLSEEPQGVERTSNGAGMFCGAGAQTIELEAARAYYIKVCFGFLS